MIELKIKVGNYFSYHTKFTFVILPLAATTKPKYKDLRV